MTFANLRAKSADELIFRLFKEYYTNHFDPGDIGDIRKREFGFMTFKGGGMIRHIAFSSTEQLKSYVKEHVPKHAYYSSAYYEDPSAEVMNEKGWQGADLIFDIDVDHIDTPCKEMHDSWICESCGKAGWGAPEKCPFCGSEKLKRTKWVCEECINVARDEALKLVDFLMNDFGFSKEELIIKFSGHRGFHIHVISEEVRSLSQDARREISEYIRGRGIEAEAYLERVRGGLYTLKVNADDPGWGGRIARALLDVMFSDEELRKAGVSDRGLRVINEWRENSVGAELPPLSERDWKRLLEYIAHRESVEIDEKVTIDIKRLIRLPGSLHGKTGLRVVRLSYSELENADILNSAIVFPSEEVGVFVKKPIRRVLNWGGFPGENSVAKVPLYLAVYLVLNGGDNFRLIL